jgi:hypothetical protein
MRVAMMNGLFVLGGGAAALTFLVGVVWRLRFIAIRRLHLLSLGIVAIGAGLWLLLLPVWIAGPALVPAVACTLAHLLVRGRRWGKPVLLVLSVVSLGLLFRAFWLLASAGTTWGNAAQAVGLVATTTLLPSLQTLALAHGSPRPFGFGKVALGVAMLFSAAGFGFERNEWVTNLEVKIRWGILVTCLGLIVEGLLLATVTPESREPLTGV